MDEQTKTTVEGLFRKYVLVWVWSIQFGVLSSVTFSLLNYSSFQRWGTLGFALIGMLILAILTAVYSWIYIYRFLSYYIIPVFFATSEVNPLESAEQRSRLAFYLKRSIFFMVLSVVFRLSMGVVELVYATLFAF